MRTEIAIISALALVLSVPVAFGEIVETKGQNYDLVENFFIGEAVWESHPERIMDNGWQNYALSNTGDKVIFNTNSVGSFIFDKNSCSYSIYGNGFDGEQIIPSVSAVATYLNNGQWQNLPVNDESCTVTVDRYEDGVYLTSTKVITEDITEDVFIPYTGTTENFYVNATNANFDLIQSSNGTNTGYFNGETITTTGIETSKFSQEIRLDIIHGFKETFKIWHDGDEQLGVSQTVHTGESITIADQTINIAELNGQSFDRQYLEDNQAQIFEIADSLNYDFDTGFESLSNVNIIFDGDYKVNMDFSEGNFVGYLEIDPTFSATGSVNGGNWDFDLSSLNAVDNGVTGGTLEGGTLTTSQISDISSNLGSTWSTSTISESYKVHKFTSTGANTFTVTAGGGTVSSLIVGGGGGGAGSGGGGGGVLQSSSTVTATSYPVTVGAGHGGGASYPSTWTTGDDSSFNGMIAGGGGNGGYTGSSTQIQMAGSNGDGTGGVADGDQGRQGINGGGSSGGFNGGQNSLYGGGGANGDGSEITAGRGGFGIYSDITGTAVSYGDGGGAGKFVFKSTGGNGNGGYGGGDQCPTISTPTYSYAVTAGTPNTGGGGGGSWICSGQGGGSGIVVVRYVDDGSITATGGTVTSLTNFQSAYPTLSLNWEVPTVPQPPTNLSTVTGIPIELDWDSPTDTGNTAITGYKVFRTLNEFAVTELPNNSANANGVDFTDNEFLIHGFETPSYKIHTFTSSDTFEITSGSGNVEVLVVGGGGGGASGGGGAGGIVHDSVKSMSTGTTSVTVGSGGSGGHAGLMGGNGGDSVFDNITANGGGGGANDNTNGAAGGSGGGGGATSIGVGAGGASTQTASGGDIGYGNAGASTATSSSPYPSNGGGGAGSTGTSGTGSSNGHGGDGIINPIIGSTIGELSGSDYYLGGGGGGGRSGLTHGDGGLGGGGSGQGTSGDIIGTANTGGGGGGTMSAGSGVGGSGVVIVKYLNDGSITATGGTVTSVTGTSLLSDKSTNSISIQNAGVYFGGDLSTATLVDTTSYSAYETAETHFEFANNGLKFYMLGDGGNTIDEWTCGTAYDMSSCTYTAQSATVSGSNPYGITVSPDGSKIWHIAQDTNTIYEHTLSTPFDITSITLNAVTKSVNSAGYSKGFQWNDDGTKFFFVGANGGNMHEWSCTSAYDLTSCTDTGVYVSISNAWGAQDFMFANEGYDLYWIEFSTDTVGHNQCSTAWTLSTCGLAIGNPPTGVEQTLSISAYDNTSNGLYVTPLGDKLFISGNDGDDITEFTMSAGTSGNFIETANPTSVTGVIDTGVQNLDVSFTDSNLPDNTDDFSVGSWVKLDEQSVTFASPQTNNHYGISTSGGSSTSCGTEYDKSSSLWRWSMQRPTSSTNTDSCVISGFQVDTSSIPDSSTITGVELTFNSQSVPGWANLSGKECAIYDVTTDLSGTVSSAMLTDVMTGTNYIGSGVTSCHSGTNTYDLGSQASTDLQNNLSNDFFAVGLGWTDFTRNSNEIGTGDVIDLSLTVTYEAPPPPQKLLGLNDVTFNVGTDSASVDELSIGTVTNADVVFDSSSLVGSITYSGNQVTSSTASWADVIKTTSTLDTTNGGELVVDISSFPTASQIIFGFGQDPLSTTSYAYDDIEYSLYLIGDGRIYKVENSVFTLLSSSGGGTGTYKITMDTNGVVKYYKGSTLYGTSSQTASGTYYFETIPHGASTSTYTYTGLGQVSNTIISATGLDDNTSSPQHYSFVRDGNDWEIYQNGAQVGSTVTDTTSLGANTGTGQVGVTWDSSSILNHGINGGTVTRNGGSGWDTWARTTTSYDSSVPQEITWTTNGGTQHMVGIGLETSAPSGSNKYVEVDYAMYKENTSNGVWILENNAFSSSQNACTGVTFSSSNVYKLSIDSNGQVVYSIDGTTCYTSTVSASGTYYLTTIAHGGTNPAQSVTSTTSGTIPLDYTTNISGMVDEYFIDSTALTSTEIDQVYENGKPLTPITTTNAVTTEYDDNTVVGGNNYYYSVKSTNAIGDSDFLTPFVSGLAGTPADPPSSVSSTINSPNTAPLDITVSWSSPSSVGSGTLTGFEIYRDSVLIDTTGLVTSYTDTVPSGGGTFEYKLKSVSSHGVSGFSGTTSTTTPTVPPTPTATPTLAIDNPNPSPLDIDVSWSAQTSGGSAITGYEIFRSADDITFTSVGTVTDLDFTDTVPSAGTWYYTFASTNLVGSSGQSPSNSITTATVPSSPLNASSVIPSVNSAPYDVTVSWELPTSTGGSDLTGYNVYRQTGSGAFTLVDTTTALGVVNTVPTALNQDYTFKIHSLNNVGESTGFVTTTITTGDVPDAPVLSVTTGTTALSWTVPSSDASITGYKIFRDSVLLTTVTTTTHSDFTTIVFGNSYDYKIVAVSSLGDSADSNTVTTTPETEITGMIAQGVTGTGAVIDWDEPAYYQGQITNYEVYYSEITASVTTPTTSAGTTTNTYSNFAPTLDYDTTYIFGVKINSPLGNSGFSNYVTVTTSVDNSIVAFDPTTGGMEWFDIDSVNDQTVNVIEFQRETQNLNVNGTFTDVDTLQVAYPSWWDDMTCNVDYKFAQKTEQYVEGDDMTAVVNSADANQQVIGFQFQDIDNEVIEVECAPQQSTQDDGVSAKYIMTQTNLSTGLPNIPLVTQVTNFTSGEYGTDGDFGAIDVVGLFVILVSMVGFNRVAPIVGVLISASTIFALSFFGLIAIPTVIVGVIGLVIFLAWGITRNR